MYYKSVDDSRNNFLLFFYNCYFNDNFNYLFNLGMPKLFLDIWTHILTSRTVMGTYNGIMGQHTDMMRIQYTGYTN